MASWVLLIGPHERVNIFGGSYPFVDEGSFFRLHELEIIRKDKVKSVEKDGSVIRIEYENGEWFEIGVEHP